MKANTWIWLSTRGKHERASDIIQRPDGEGDSRRQKDHDAEGREDLNPMCPVIISMAYHVFMGISAHSKPTVGTFPGSRDLKQRTGKLGMNLHDLQVAGDWASFESVKSYARANIAKKRALINRKVVSIEDGKKEQKR